MAVVEGEPQGAERTASIQPEALYPGALLELWDMCVSAALPQRARAILRASYPEVRAEELDAMAIGAWNSALLRFRAAQFGTELQVYDRCPHCQGTVEFAIETNNILKKAAPGLHEGKLISGDWNVRFRVLTGDDWLQSFHPGDSEPVAAAKRLLGRAILQVRRGPNDAAAEEMPEVAWEALAEALVQADSASEIVFTLRCPSCGERWDSPLEPAEFVWREINAVCRRLLRHVHVLASVYGWSESEILGLSHERRSSYLHLIEEAGGPPSN
jgi:hypothetical protein